MRLAGDALGVSIDSCKHQWRHAADCGQNSIATWRIMTRLRKRVALNPGRLALEASASSADIRATAEIRQ